jgi:hypothetical protein
VLHNCTTTTENLIIGVRSENDRFAAPKSLLSLVRDLLRLNARHIDVNIPDNLKLLTDQQSSPPPEGIKVPKNLRITDS